MNPAEAINDRLCPFEVFPLAINRPVGRRRCRDVAQIADLVREFDQLCAPADMRGMLDLEALALCLGQRLVIGNFKDDIGDVLAEVLHQFLFGRVGVFDRVVQDGGDQDALILDTRFIE